MDVLQQIEGELAALRRAGRLDRALRRWKTSGDGLGSFDDAEALIAFLRDASPARRGTKDSALAAICVEANRGDQVAATLLLWLMLPALLRLRHRFVASNTLGPEDLDAELVAGVWEAASAIGPGATGVGARMVNRARRRALAAIRRAAEWAARSEPLSTDIVDETNPPDVDALQESLREAVRAGVISTAEAELICTTRDTIGEVRQRLGLSLYGAQLRRQRARLRLREWLADSR